MEKLTMTVEEMGEALGVGRVTAYELANSRDFPKVRIGKRILIPKEALNKWLESEVEKNSSDYVVVNFGE